MSVGSAVAAASTLRGHVSRLVLAAAVAAALVVGLGGGVQARAASALSPRVPAGSATFSGMSCVGKSFCIAVGNYSKPGHPNLTLLEAWNGKSWRVIPNPRGSLFAFSVTCGGPSFCLAAVSLPHNAYTVEWNGRTWQILKRQPPDVLSVACASPTFCVSLDGSLGPVGWNGKSWQGMTQDSGGCGGPDCQYDQGVGCASVTDCTVSGSFCSDDNCDSTVYFEQTWTGSAWYLSANPPFGGEQACAGRAFCIDVDPFKKVAAVTYDWWNSSRDASSNLAALCRRLAGCPVLRDLACGSPWFCVAFPFSYPTAVLTWNGARWKAVPLPRVDGHLAKLTGLTCGTARNCFAFGTYQLTPRGYPRPIAEHWNGSAWKTTRMPNP